MKWLIRGVQTGIAAHIIWATATAIIITLALGKTVDFPLSFIGLAYPERVYGIPGEAYFSSPFHTAVFLNRLLYLYAFYRLWRMFGAFADRHYFAQRTISHLYAFTGLFTLFTLSRIAISWIFIATSSSAFPVGETLEINFSDLEDLGYPVIFFIIAHIFNQARKNEEELDNYF